MGSIPTRADAFRWSFRTANASDIGSPLRSWRSGHQTHRILPSLRLPGGKRHDLSGEIHQDAFSNQGHEMVVWVPSMSSDCREQDIPGVAREDETGPWPSRLSISPSP